VRNVRGKKKKRQKEVPSKERVQRRVWNLREGGEKKEQKGIAKIYSEEKEATSSFKNSRRAHDIGGGGVNAGRKREAGVGSKILC